MNIGLVIAIERELKAFLRSGEDIRTLQADGKTVYSCRLNGHEIFALQSGYGEIDAAAATQLLISRFGCRLIVNFGVTGALERSLKTEDLFVVTGVCHYDYDVSAVDPVRKHQYAEFPDEFIPLDAALAEKTAALLPGIRLARVASGDRFVADPGEKDALHALGCDICDMEIAAIARVSWLCGVPCVSVKCISDTFDGDGRDFQRNVTRSAEKAYRVIDALLRSLP